MTELTESAVSARLASSAIWSLMLSIVSTSKNLLAMKPMLPASPKISGGSERIAKKAASAASPVTR